MPWRPSQEIKAPALWCVMRCRHIVVLGALQEPYDVHVVQIPFVQPSILFLCGYYSTSCSTCFVSMDVTRASKSFFTLINCIFNLNPTFLLNVHLTYVGQEDHMLMLMNITK